MRLLSNFTDYYDHAFDRDGYEFRRLGTEGLPKPEQFKVMREGGLRVAPHGTVAELLEHPDPPFRIKYLVVYDDVWAHCTEGKRLVQECRLRFDGNVSRLPFLHNESLKFASAFVGNPWKRPSVSWRMLWVGRHRFWSECRSEESWMSNYGEGSWDLIGVERDYGLCPWFGWPLFAVDFAIGDELYAVDLNTAPGVRGTGVDKVLPAWELYEELKFAVESGKRTPPLPRPS